MTAPGRDSGPHPEVLDHAFAQEERRRRSLWEEDPVGTRRMPDPVRRSAVRAYLIGAFTLIEVNVAVLGAMAQSWVAAPATLAAVVSTVVATWAVLDVWITRQVHVQRHGVVSGPSSTARVSRRERRTRARRGGGGKVNAPRAA
jgi:hypothetical protein